MTSAAAAIEVQGVSKVFRSSGGDVRALDDVSVTIAENEFFTLLGPSGCGKTTLLRLIAGFDHPSAGQLRLHGDDITALPPNKRPINTVFQSYALFPHMSVARNIGFGLEMQNRPQAEIEAAVDGMLALVRMTALKNRRTSQISGGQQQRVALARALAPKPQVLLLDEPLSALDLKLRKEMQSELKRLQHETGVTFIFVTHDQEEALTMSDRIAVMNDGKVLQIGAPRDIYAHPVDRFVADFIGETNFLAGTVRAVGDGEATVALRAGPTLSAAISIDAAPGAGASATVAVRPEHVRITAVDAALFGSGRLTDIVYFGTDTLHHVALASGETIVARTQNRPTDSAEAEIGDEVGLAIDPGALQLLKD